MCAAMAMLIGLSSPAQDQSPEKSPLERLRERSAETRWQQQRHQWMTLDSAAHEERTSETDEVDGDGPEVPVAERRAGAAVIPAAPAQRESPQEVETAPSRPVQARASIGTATVVNPDAAPVAPVRDRAQLPEPQIPDPQPMPAARLPFEINANHRSLPQQDEVLPLPAFLAGADPPGFSPRPDAAVYFDLNAAVSGLARLQTQTPQEGAPFAYETRERGVLRPITEISPFFDYDPDGGDPCEHLCPVPSSICEAGSAYLCPVEEPLPDSTSPERYFAHMNYFWSASNVFYNPLYFDDPALERYGHVHIHDAIQPLYSVARFGSQLVGLPYQMSLHPIHDRVYPLGYYRPGDPAPKLIYQPPLNARAGAVAAGIYAGLFFLVP